MRLELRLLGRISGLWVLLFLAAVQPVWAQAQGLSAAATPAAIETAAGTAARTAAGDVELGLYGGWSFLSADNQLGNAPNGAMRPGSGVILGGRGSVALTRSVAVEAEADYTLASFGDSSLAAGVLGWRLLGLWHVGQLQLAGAAMRPFLAAGVGGESLRWREYGTEFDTDIAAHLGVGLKAALSERVGLRFDLRYVAMDGAEQPLSHSFELLLGLTLRPNSAPQDRDGDGVRDSVDRCPAQAEDKDRWQDDDGCPDLDSDGDGVTDGADKCPDKIGAAADHGCPPPDADKDGIPDATDKCPNKAETYNGVKDEDGCPDGKQTVVMTDRGVDTSQRIYFEAGKSTIQRRSHRLLDSVAALLRAHPEVTAVAIEGHTDDVGVAAENLVLSRARASAVLVYLVMKGVAKKRLSAAGFGSERPLCTTLGVLLKREAANRLKISHCRERNRRVEFVVRGRAVPSNATHNEG